LGEWSQVHPEFSDAIAVAKMKRVAFLEAEAMASTSGTAIGLRLRTLANLTPDS
jgi:hypothetical protein